MSVWGITAIWKPYFKILAIVKETPLIVIDPFGMRYFLYLSDNLKLISQDFQIKSILFTNEVVSTWPLTKWPDTRSPNFNDFSRGVDFFDGRDGQHRKNYKNLVYEQYKWDGRNIFYYVNTEGELVLRINEQYTYEA